MKPKNKRKQPRERTESTARLMLKVAIFQLAVGIVQLIISAVELFK